ncbi:glycosyltransferase family 4 protein [Candidatus Phycosocius spiralis]|uniref:Undecaprenyl-phosphate alpha-N-acetylglucosaminyl 1-phosphate transferase n=1 Tax=Candidatus Phycosocius spiralis TaxID=2815099 RepID=A0ABQ4PSS9_9PROT|nr:hypothetical protein [Candidatus Phycosocius spiralis]GIU66045.1 undecaprenyl-phosphate alpha-N-acetylglucosaminyl 1-phosphate transferase [Candidatus Phycosocius spiralis]
MIVWSIKDVPDSKRKLHLTPTPTAGGVGIMAGTVLGLMTLWIATPSAISPPLLMCLALGLSGGGLGLWDDITNAGPKLKLVLMVALTLSFVLFGLRIEYLPLLTGLDLELGPILGGFGTLIWLLVMVNVVNFMDGANGLAIGSAFIGLLGLMGLRLIETPLDDSELTSAFLCAVCSAACIGFLYWNVRDGRIFAGDSGALFIGLMVGGLGAWACVDGVNPFAVALCFLPMLSDVILTILWRIGQKADLFQAHRDHVYQRAIQFGYSHGQVAFVYWGLTLLCVIGAWLGQKLGASATLLIFGICFTFGCFGLTRVRAKYTPNS